MQTVKLSYAQAIREGFHYLLKTHQDVFAIGQGVWAPWYVGSSMKDLDQEFGRDRVIDSPVSEAACTGAAVGAALCGYRPIVIHPRVDFMVLAIDQIVNQAAKWSAMFGGQTSPAVTFRAITNRGGEQGAQHSQALHSWFAHVPGLKVVMPFTVEDARDLLIASVLDDAPVLYIDDRWLYESVADVAPVRECALDQMGPRVLRNGENITLVGAGFSTRLCLDAAERLKKHDISAEVIDLRIINPLKTDVLEQSVAKTGRLVAVDGGWRTCGLAAEIVASVVESVSPSLLKSAPIRVTLPDAPAPTSGALEAIYYPSVDDVIAAVKFSILSDESAGTSASSIKIFRDTRSENGELMLQGN